MNKNKIIFLIIGVLVVVFIVAIVAMLNASKGTKKTGNGTKNFTIWIVGDEKTKFYNVLNDFKEKYPKYKNNNFDVISFPSYDEYYNSLVGAFLTGRAPDIFAVNNNDSNFFDLQVMGIDPTIISPDDFRKNYESVFSDDLIRKTKVEDKEVEFLAGIPLGYETLGLFYNFREVKGKNLSTWSYINEAIREIKEESGKGGIGIGNGSTVAMVEDILTQFFILDGIEKLQDATGDKLKSAISNYLRFGDENLDNGYNRYYQELTTSNKNNVNLFSQGEIQMILGYPRLIEDIDKSGFNKGFLRADVFPMYTKDSGKLLVNYNYLVVNKNTPNVEFSLDLMKYFASAEGQKKYLEVYPYYLPSLLSLRDERLQENLKDGYTLKYKNFYNPNLELISFKKGIRAIYDKEVSLLLDKTVNSIDLFDILRKRLLCISTKMVTGESLESTCK